MRKKISALILKFWEEGIPVDIINDAQKFADYNEWGVAFDLLIEYVFENDIAISEELYGMIADAGRSMKLPENEYIFVKDLVRASSSTS